MRNEKGVTLVTLILTIIIIFILAGIGVYTGVEAYKTMKIQKFMAQMTVVQERVNVICDNWKNWENYDRDEAMNLENYIKDSLKVENPSSPTGYDEPQKASSTANPEFEAILSSGQTNLEANDLIISNYFYFSSEDLEKFLGLRDLDINVIINFASRNFVEKTGVESIDTNGNTKTYHVLEDLVEAQRLTATIIENIVAEEEISDYYKYLETKINNNAGDSKEVSVVLNVKIKKPIKGVYYSTQEFASVNEFEDTSKWTILTGYDLSNDEIKVDLDVNGKYYFKVVDNKENEFYTKDGINIELANAPILESGMTPIYFENGEIIETTIDNPNWYDYSKDAKKWANVRLEDGSIFVWIPRFAYKIDNTNEKIEIEFLKDGSNDITIDGDVITTGYTVHPAFQSGISLSPKYKNGEWDEEINGIWISKFNANIEQINGKEILTTAFGKNITKLYNVENALKVCRMMESKGRYGFSSLAKGELSNTLTFAEDTNEIDTHLMKNSELGAMLYLSWSDYGNAKIDIKNNDTGIAGGSNVESEVFQNRVDTSTTGNAYGVYDIMKLTGEFVASGLEVAVEDISTSEALRKYFTIYSNDSGVNSIYGDGIFELSSWEITREYPTTDDSVFLRGNTIDNVFSYENVNPEINDGFYIRPVIIINN